MHPILFLLLSIVVLIYFAVRPFPDSTDEAASEQRKRPGKRRRRD